MAPYLGFQSFTNACCFILVQQCPLKGLFKRVQLLRCVVQVSILKLDIALEEDSAIRIIARREAVVTSQRYRVKPVHLVQPRPELYRQQEPLPQHWPQISCVHTNRLMNRKCRLCEPGPQCKVRHLNSTMEIATSKSETERLPAAARSLVRVQQCRSFTSWSSWPLYASGWKGPAARCDWMALSL